MGLREKVPSIPQGSAGKCEENVYFWNMRTEGRSPEMQFQKILKT